MLDSRTDKDAEERENQRLFKAVQQIAQTVPTFEGQLYCQNRMRILLVKEGEKVPQLFDGTYNLILRQKKNEATPSSADFIDKTRYFERKNTIDFSPTHTLANFLTQIQDSQGNIKTGYLSSTEYSKAATALPLISQLALTTKENEKLPITDHAPVVSKCPKIAGPIVSLNIWNPGSPISKKDHPKGNKQFDEKAQAVLTEKFYEEQIKKIAEYIASMLAAGTSALMLQEVPKDKNLRNLLIDETIRHCGNCKPPISLDRAQIEASFEARTTLKAPTKNNTVATTVEGNHGTCAIINQARVATCHKIPSTELANVLHPTTIPESMNGHFALYAMKRPDGSSFYMANVHADGGPQQQKDTKKFIEDLIKKGMIIGGDFNLAKSTKITLTQEENAALLASGDTLDGIFIPDPNKLLAAAPTPTPSRNRIATNPNPSITISADNSNSATVTPTILAVSSTTPKPPYKAPGEQDPLDPDKFHANLSAYAALANYYRDLAWLAQGSWSQLENLAQVQNNCDKLIQNLETSNLKDLADKDKIAKILQESSDLCKTLINDGPKKTYIFCNHHLKSGSTADNLAVAAELKSITSRDVKLDHFMPNYVLGSVSTGATKSAFVQGNKNDNTFVSEAYLSAKLLVDQNALKEFVLAQIESFRADPRSVGQKMEFRGNFSKGYLIEAINYCKLRGYEWQLEDALKNKVLNKATATEKPDLENLFDSQVSPPYKNIAAEDGWKKWLVDNNKYPFSKLVSSDQIKAEEIKLSLQSLPAAQQTQAETDAEALAKKHTTTTLEPIGEAIIPLPLPSPSPNSSRPPILKRPSPAPQSTTASFKPNDTIAMINTMQKNKITTPVQDCFLNTGIDQILRDKIERCQRSVRIHVSPTWQAWASTTPLQDTMKFTNPGYAVDTSNTTALKNAGLLAPEATDKNASEHRQYTKFRVITGDVVLLGEPKFATVSVMTTAAPNLSTSAEDLKKYASKVSDKQPTKYKLDLSAYEQACNEQADLICRAAKDQGFDKICLPDFGLGVYLTKLDDDGKENARNAMLTAFSEKAKNHGIKIDWIFFDKDPDSDKKHNASKKLKLPNITFKTGNLLTEMKNAADSGEKTTFINPGSDRTIGGEFTNLNAKTLEEQIAQQTSLLHVMSACFNPHVEGAYKRVHNMADDLAFVPPDAPNAPAYRAVNKDAFPAPAGYQDDTVPIKTIQLFEGGLTYVPFYDAKFENYLFANYSKEKIKGLDNIDYDSPENYFQAQKFAAHPQFHQLFRSLTRNPLSSDQARILAGNIFQGPSNYNMPPQAITTIKKEWFGKKDYEAMLNVVRARCKSTPEFLNTLLLTKDAYILEDTYRGPGGTADSKWGGGADGMGENLLGKALMQVRQECRMNNDKPLLTEAELKTFDVHLNSFNDNFISMRTKARDERKKVDQLLDVICKDPTANEKNQIIKERKAKTPLALAQLYVRANSCPQDKRDTLCQEWKVAWNPVPTATPKLTAKPS